MDKAPILTEWECYAKEVLVEGDFEPGNTGELIYDDIEDGLIAQRDADHQFYEARMSEINKEYTRHYKDWESAAMKAEKAIIVKYEARIAEAVKEERERIAQELQKLVGNSSVSLDFNKWRKFLSALEQGGE